ncbi:hypothetical protein GCK72_007848 [Caenorhabditis remanei]|uniref:Uncharacterized protein n=1 Tax=Caenorhabditis remanei TaxID=31234 RepID=A0A6A5HK58_CAERE|nr:hypothetical protein GCK72_007848 [Caenorhabditis remanei]KAF1767889.1 hypothetical protein GCK72_007848 [Caenorhabditis remanei]
MWVSSDELNAKKTVCHTRNVESNREFAHSDIVASFVHNRPKNLSELTFERHGKAGRKKAPILSVKGGISEKVVEMGQDVNCLDEGFDFAVAIVDTTTGLATYRPARLYSFESKYSEDVEKLLNGDKKSLSGDNFSEDFSISAEKWAEKRRQLTSNFGSSKKIKMDEAAQRRTINQETRRQVRRYHYDGQSDVIDSTESGTIGIGKGYLSDFSFIEDLEVEAVEQIAVELMELKKKSKKALIEAGIPDCVTLIMYNETVPKRAAAYLLLATMCEMLGKMGKQRQMLRKEMAELKMPDVLRQKVKIDEKSNRSSLANRRLKKGYTGRGAERIRLNVTDYDRFVAHTLALALTLAPEHKVPLTPFQQVVGMQPSKLEKMFQALGADLLRLDVHTAQTLRSLRAARPLKTTESRAEGPRKIIRR